MLAPVVAPRQELSGATEGLSIKTPAGSASGPQLGSRGNDPMEQTVLTWRESFLPVFLCIHVHPLAVSLGALNAFSASSALFLDVLEKTVEGEAAALTQAKTLYKSCTNERKSAGLARAWPSLLSSIFISAAVDVT